ncbi:MAG: molybdenum cofactor guanylyltransferase [Actinomycetes bacterium]
MLTGGASRRMGRDKAFVEVEGSAMARRVADALVAAGCGPVLAVGGDAVGLSTLGLVAVPDRWPGEGPLGGIRTALAHVSEQVSEQESGQEPGQEPAGAPVLVVATDLPWLDATTLGALLEHVSRTDLDVVVARSGRLEPLCALWWPSAAGPLAAAFDAGERAVHRAIAGMRVQEVAVDGAALVNVNRPDDLAGPVTGAP